MVIRNIKFILAVLLLICLLRMPYGYYEFVRLSAFIGFGYLAFDVSRRQRQMEFLIFVLLALLFQPFYKIALGRVLWNVVDVVVAAGLLLALLKRERRADN